MEEILSGTFLAILFFLAITKAAGFQTVVSSVGTLFINAVSVLQGNQIPKSS